MVLLEQSSKNSTADVNGLPTCALPAYEDIEATCRELSNRHIGIRNARKITLGIWMSELEFRDTPGRSLAAEDSIRFALN